MPSFQSYRTFPSILWALLFRARRFAYVLWLVATATAIPANQVRAQSEEDRPPRGVALRQLDAALAKIVELWTNDPEDRSLVAKVDAVAGRVEAILRKDLLKGTSDSQDWTFSEGHGVSSGIEAIWGVYFTAKRTVDELKWRELWLLAGANFLGAASVTDAGLRFGILIDAKYRAPELYERVLAVYAKSEDCGEVKAMELKKSCILLRIADRLREDGATQSGFELDYDALKRVFAAKSASLSLRIETSLSLAYAEWLVGSAIAAEGLLDRAIEAMPRNADVLPARIRFAAAMLQAERARMRLDDAAAAHHLIIATQHFVAAQAERVNNRFDDRLIEEATHVLLNFVSQYAHLPRCHTCAPVYKAIHALFWKVLEIQGANGSDGSASYIVDLFNAVAGHDQVFSEGEFREIEEHIRSSGVDRNFLDAVTARLSGTKQEPLALRIAALALQAGANQDIFAEFFASTNAEAAQKLRDYVVSAGQTNPDDTPILTNFKWMPRLAIALRTLRALPAERVVLQVLMDDYNRPLDHVGYDKSSLAAIIAPIFTRLAYFQVKDGDLASAQALADQASAAFLQKLRREWRAGEQRAAGAFRDLATALSENLALRIAISAKSADVRASEGIFQTFQLALLGETAAVLQAATKRRIASESALAAAFTDSVTASGTMERYEAIMQSTSGPTGPKLVGLERQLAIGKSVLDRAQGEISKRLKSDALAATVEPIALGDAARALGAGEGLVLLHAGEDAVAGLLLQSSGAVRVWTTAMPRTDLEALVATVRLGTYDNKKPFPTNTAADLFETLLGPIRDELAGLRHLIVLTDGPLQSLPFAILPTERLKSDPEDDGALVNADVKWLIRTHALTATPSVRALVEQRRATSQSKAARAFLGVGNPIFQGAVGLKRGVDFKGVLGVKKLAQLDVIRGFAELPETAYELRELGKILSGSTSDLLLGKDATERRVKGLKLTDYRIVAFATHGLIAGDAGGDTEPGLALTPPQEASDVDDGLLTTSEIMALRFDADLVVLSACDTASSNGLPRAEGLSGLALSFFGAGARALLVTHWPIPSLPAVEITTKSARAWLDNPSLGWAGALQQAQVRLALDKSRPEFAHPSSWGAFQLVGVSGPAQRQAGPP